MDKHAFLQRIEERFTLDTQRMLRLQKAWLEIYRYYSAPLHLDQQIMFAEDMMNFDPEAVRQAMSIWRVTPPKGEQKPRPPLPVDLLPLLTGYISPDAEATHLAARIFAAFSDVGRNDIDRAKRVLGPVAWDVVTQMGGWQKLCAEAETSQRFIFQAQARDIAKGLLERERNSQVVVYPHEHAPALPLPSAQPIVVAAVHTQVLPEPMRRMPKPSRYLDEINAMVAGLAHKMAAHSDSQSGPGSAAI